MDDDAAPCLGCGRYTCRCGEEDPEQDRVIARPDRQEGAYDGA
jgi:hypothetical protein